MTLFPRRTLAALAATACLGLSSRAHAADPAPPAVTAPTTMTTADGQVVLVVPTPPGTTIAILPPLPPTVEAPPPPVLVPAPPPPVEVRPLAGPTALVHLNGPASLTLEGVPAGETTWKPLCSAPCDASVPLDALYRVTAPSSQPTKAFRLAAMAGERVVIDADLTSEGTHVGGEALMVVGGVGLVGGGIILYLDAVARAVCFQANCGPSRGLAYTGVGAMVAGAAALVTGIVLIQPAAVDQSTSLRAQARGPRARPEDWLRTPTWHEPGPEAAALPKAVSIPLLSGSF